MLGNCGDSEEEGGRRHGKVGGMKDELSVLPALLPENNLKLGN